MNSDASPAKDAALEPMSGEAVPFEISQDPVTPEGEGKPGASVPPAPAYEHLGELPATYGTQSVYLVAYDPKQLFVYWDVDWTAGPNTPPALHVCRGDGSLEQQVEIVAAEAGRYLPARTAGGTYFVELGKYGRDGRWQVVATSTPVTMPPTGLAGDIEPQFATLPFHLSFQRLMELIHDAMGHDEDLTAALVRLQHGDQPGLSAIAGTLSQLGPEPLHTLETLLGQKFEVSSAGNASSPTGGETPSLHRDRHDVLAASAFASEGLSSVDLSSGRGFGGGSETLSSGAFSSGAFTAGIGGGENLSSGGFSSGSFFGGPGGRETLEAFAAGLSSESLSSFGAGSEAWHLAAGGSSSSGGGFGGGGNADAHERVERLLKALEHQLGMLGGLFSDLSSGSGGR